MTDLPKMVWFDLLQLVQVSKSLDGLSVSTQSPTKSKQQLWGISDVKICLCYLLSVFSSGDVKRL